MNELFSSFVEYWNKRTKTQFYGWFIFWWIVLHAQYFYTLLFVDQQIIYAEKKMLKNEYIWSEIIKYNSLGWWLMQIVLLGLTLFLTWFMVWIFPHYVLLRFYKKERTNELERQRIKFKHQKEQAKEKERYLVAEKAVITAENGVKDEQAILNSAWYNDFLQFKKTNLFNKFSDIEESLYGHNGFIRVDDFDILFNIDKSVLAYVDAEGLVNIDGNTISLTEKGRFFMKQYLAETHKR